MFQTLLTFTYHQRTLVIITYYYYMARKYRRKRGSQVYGNYSDETVKRCLKDVKRGKGQNKMARVHKIPKSTLSRKVRGLQTKRSGGQLALGVEFETKLVGILDELARWKVPVTSLDVRLIVKHALEEDGIRHKRFRENLPGPDWLRGFRKRHKLSLRTPDSVKVKRFTVSKEELEEYYANLKKTLDGVPPENIYNYDETSLNDDPLATKVIVRRGFGRVEKKTECERLGYSVMFSGNATGEYLPPMVIYKAESECVYTEWIKGGPKGACYGSTVTGWFNKRMFEQWFEKLFIPAVEKKDGPKVIIGDNLSSHLSINVITKCLAKNVRFTTLVPYSTHILQPLDVAVFGPLKKTWRLELDDWRIQCSSRYRLTKDNFPYRLKRLIGEYGNDMEKQQRSNALKQTLISGFRATGIYPFDPDKGLRTLPGKQSPTDTRSSLNSAVVKILKRHCKSTTQVKVKRGKKIAVPPGKTVTEDDLLDETWTCSGYRCGKVWKFDDNKWIVCDRDTCGRQYHLQCSGIRYKEEEYEQFTEKYILELSWTCKNCN